MGFVSAWSRRLEVGDGPRLGPLGAALARVMERSLARPLARRPAGPPVVAVGGATLGGSCKTPLSLACAEELHRAGARVVIVGHGYRAGRRDARVVDPRETARDAGDDALFLARKGEGRFQVVIGPTRQAACDLAGATCDVVILDGPLQLAPTRADLSLLALDAAAPFSMGRLLPEGDLRARPDVLLGLADLAVMVALEVDVDLHALEGARIGVFTALARPDRFVAACAGRGVPIVHRVAFRDHGPVDPQAIAHATRAHHIDVWLTTEKCALHLQGAHGVGAPIQAIPARFTLPDSVCTRLRALPRGQRTWPLG